MATYISPSKSRSDHNITSDIDSLISELSGVKDRITRGPGAGAEGMMNTYYSSMSDGLGAIRDDIEILRTKLWHRHTNNNKKNTNGIEFPMNDNRNFPQSVPRSLSYNKTRKARKNRKNRK